MYSYDDNHNKLKGLSKVSAKNITIKDYEKTLNENSTSEHSNYVLRSDNHQMYLQEIKKSTLNASDDKRYYLRAINSIPYGSSVNSYAEYLSREIVKDVLQ